MQDGAVLARAGRRNGRHSRVQEATEEAIVHLRGEVRRGRAWHVALLEAIGLWRAPEEVYRGRLYRYLLGGEALDWLLLSERLLYEVEGDVPPEQREQLLLDHEFPQPVSWDDFRSLLGPMKWRAYLNYWYGVVVEDALQAVVEQEWHKALRMKGLPDKGRAEEEAFASIYGADRPELLGRFLDEEGLSPEEPGLSLSEYREFTYWLFKHRVRTQDPARVASDTRKGLEHLQQLSGSAGPAQPRPE